MPFDEEVGNPLQFRHRQEIQIAHEAFSSLIRNATLFNYPLCL
jgi:hypothetical protein